jgi:predicted permease
MWPRLGAFVSRVGFVIHRRRLDEEARAELDAHLELLVDRYQRAGLTAAEARTAARRQFGNVTAIHEVVHEMNGVQWIDGVAQDLRYAVRSLRHHVGFAVTVVATLGVGIGLSTGLFSVVYGLLIRPLPFNAPSELVALQTADGTARPDGGLSPPNFMSLLETPPQTLARLAGVVETELTLTGAGDAERLVGARVSDGFFDVLDVRPILGRTFRLDEHGSGRERVVILSHALWRQRFSGASDIIGQTIQLNAIGHTVVGVMASGLDFPSQSALWVPQAYGQDYFSAAITESRRNNAYVRVIGRLRRDVTIETARAELRGIGHQLESRFPETNANVTFTAMPLQEQLVGDLRVPLAVLLGAVMCVLLIAATNVAGMFLARGATRREEMVLRSALGAGRARLIRQLVTESLVLSTGGGLLGVMFAFWFTSRIVVAQSESLQRLGLLDAIRIDGAVLAAACALSLLSGVLAALGPAIRIVKDSLTGDGHLGRRASASWIRLRSGLVVAQLALAVILLDGAGLLIRSFVMLTTVDLGFTPANVLSFRVDLPRPVYASNDQSARFFDRLLESLSQHAGVRSVGSISRLPVGQPSAFSSRFQVAAVAPGNTEPSIGVRIVSPGYFRTMQVPVLRGRDVLPTDRQGVSPVVVINEAAAEAFFSGRDPIGQQIGSFSYDPIEQAASTFTIVGVVANTRSLRLRLPASPEAYFSHAQVPLPEMFVMVRTVGDPFVYADVFRSDVRTLDPNLPVRAVQTFDQVLATSLTRDRVMTSMLSLFSSVALTLALVGIFGLLSFSVARRQREIAVRKALGQSFGGIVTGIVGEAAVLVVIGLGIGLGGVLAFVRLLESELFGVKSTDPLTFIGVGIALAGTALLASLLPAWRAAAVDPALVLRAD